MSSNTPSTIPSTTASTVPPVTSSTTPSATLPTTTPSSAAPPTTTSALPSTTPSTSAAPPPTTSSVPPTTSSQAPSSSAPTTIPSSSGDAFTTTILSTENGSTVFKTITSTTIQTSSQASVSDPSSSSTSGGLVQGNDSAAGGLNGPGKIAVAVVVPIAGVALLVVAGIFLWRKRKQRKDAEEERRKEVEDYIYNPNADPTLPDLGNSGGAAGAYEMKEDAASSGYRGWGSTTMAGSTGQKASTTMSGGAAGVAYSDGTSPIGGAISDTRSGEPLMSDGSHTPEGEILGVMGPASGDNRGNVRRGPSNASSSYSAAGRSDGSGENNIGVAYGGPAGYYDQYGTSNPYMDNTPQRPGELAGQPVIRDNPARRNTRIENPSHYPQQSAGISQNF